MSPWLIFRFYLQRFQCSSRVVYFSYQFLEIRQLPLYSRPFATLKDFIGFFLQLFQVVLGLKRRFSVFHVF